jgi:hypothetical protein
MLLAAVGVGWASGCANQGAPPGGPQDRRPPVIVRTEPEALAAVTDLRRAVRFHFDERISEQVAGGTLQDAVTVSPRGGAVRVSHGSRSVTVEVEGGLRPGVVYRVTLLPVVRDLFGNQLVDPFELVFSTGGEPTPTALAGQVWDRVSGQGVAGATVSAVGSDSLVHVARADAQGIFAFRYLPAGTFVVTGFDDLDRDGEPGPREVKGSVPATLAAGDTLLVDVAILAPDTTAAVLARASALDSVTLVLEHDDYLDPASEAAGVAVVLSRQTGDAPAVSRLFHEHEYAAYVREVTDSLAALGGAGAPGAPVARADSAALPVDPSVAPAPPDAVAPSDTAAGAPGAGVARAPAAAGAPAAARPGPRQLPGVRGGGGRGVGPGGAQAAAAASGRVLPGRRLVALLDAPLEVGVEYQVRVTSVVNLNGVPGGGGETTLLLDAPPPAPSPPPQDDPALPDSVAAPGDLPGAAPPPDSVPPGDGAR